MPFASVLFFAACFALAIGKVRDNEWHKRLMILAMIPLMHAAIARVFMLVLAPPGHVGPVSVGLTVLPGFTADMLVVAAIFYDCSPESIGEHSMYIATRE